MIKIMRKEYHIFGKKLTFDEAKKAVCYLEREKQKYSRPLEGEIEKTPDELKFIETINQYLNQEFEELGIKETPDVAPEQIHLLTREGYKKYAPREPSGAVSDPMKQGVIIDKSSRTNRLALYKTIFHESIHLLGCKKYCFDAEYKMVKPYRSGYATHHPESAYHEHFRGLNEAVIDKIIIEIFNKHKDELKKEFNITPKENQESIVYFYPWVEILNKIIQEIAEKNNEDEKMAWQRFKKGYFTGEMMHLREIEKTFGKGALRVLAAVESDIKDVPEEKMKQQLLEYFETDDERTKNKIAAEILSERERLKYLIRKN